MKLKHITRHFHIERTSAKETEIGKREECNMAMKKMNWSQIVNIVIFAVLVLVEIYLLYFLRRYVYMQLSSDDASEMVLGHLLSQQNAIISKDWYYSTEIRFLNTNLVYSLFFKLFSGKNWHFVRLASTCAMHMVMIFSLWYLCNRMNHKECFPLSALAIMLPMSTDYYIITLKGAFYIPHITISFLGMALIMEAINFHGWRRGTSISLSILLAFLSCIGGARQLIILYLPLMLSAFLVSAEEFRKRGFEKYKSMPYFVATLASVLTFVGGVAGYLVNTNYLSKVYFFKQWDTIIYKAFDWNSLVRVLNGFLNTYGFVADRIDAPHTISNLIAAVIMVLTVVAVMYPLRHRDSVTKEYYFLATFFSSAIVVFILLYTMTSMTYEVRYNQPIAVFSYILIVMWIGEGLNGERKKLVSLLASAVVCVIASILVYSAMIDSLQENEYTNELEDIANVALAGDYRNGYGSFWRSNVLTELSNGQIDMRSWGDSGSNEDLSEFKNVNAVYPWLQLKSHETGKPEGKVFMIFTTNEFNSCVWKAELPDDRLIYFSDNYRAYGFENYEDMINTIGGYSFAFGNNLWTINCYDKGNIRIIEPGGISYGPYMQYYEGYYSVEIKGQGLSSTYYWCSYGLGKQNIELENVDETDNHIVFTFHCSDDFANGEIGIRNDSQDEVEIDSIRISRIAAGGQ